MAAFVTRIPKTNQYLNFVPQHKIEDISFLRGQVVRKSAQAGFGKQLVSGPRVRQTKKNDNISPASVAVKCSVQFNWYPLCENN